jgi:hypothetical protein
MANKGNYLYGILLQNSANNNTIGSASSPAPSNVVSGNGFGNDLVNQGMGIAIQSSNSNVIQTNYIGTANDGTTKLGNRNDGIYVDGGSQSNTIGGTIVNARNISSGNGRNGLGYGINMLGSNDTIANNYFGLDKNGAQLPNSAGGAYMGGSNNSWQYNSFQSGGSPIRRSPVAMLAKEPSSILFTSAGASPGNDISLFVRTNNAPFSNSGSTASTGLPAAAPTAAKPIFDYVLASGARTGWSPSELFPAELGKWAT